MEKPVRLLPIILLSGILYTFWLGMERIAYPDVPAAVPKAVSASEQPVIVLADTSGHPSPLIAISDLFDRVEEDERISADPNRPHQMSDPIEDRDVALCMLYDAIKEVRLEELPRKIVWYLAQHLRQYYCEDTAIIVVVPFRAAEAPQPGSSLARCGPGKHATWSSEVSRSRGRPWCRALWAY